MVGYMLLFHRPECAQSDMQHDRRDFHAHRANFGKQLLREMKPRSWSGSRTALVCVDGLIAFFVVQLFGYIRRQRHLPHFVEHRINAAALV